MTTKIRNIIIASCILCIIACSKQEQGEESINLVINAVCPGEVIFENSQTKADGQVVIITKWKSGDKISVINLTKGLILGGDLTADQAGTTTTFSGSFSSSSISEGDKLAFIYPSLNASSDASFSSSEVDFASQTGYMLSMMGSTTASSNQFSNYLVNFDFQMAFIRLNMSDMPSKTAISRLEISNMPTKLEYYIDGGVLKSRAKSSKGTITYTKSFTPGKSGTSTVMMGVVPVTLSSENIVTIYTGTTSYSVPLWTISLTANSNANINLSGFVPSNISFADASVASTCISMFDQNSDGFVSFVEAAAVTDLGVSTKSAGDNPFPNTIQSFEELKFFSGLTSIPSFQSYSDLRAIAIPPQITSIPANAFKGCSTLETVIFASTTPPSIGADAFEGCSAGITYYVPTGSVEAYKTAWPAMAGNIHDVEGQGSEDGSNLENPKMGEEWNWN